MLLNEFLTKNEQRLDKNIYKFSENEDSEFQKAYISLRKKEKRDNLQLAHEWKLRKKSAEKIKKYISSKFPDGTILEIGCGNGWLCNYLSSETNLIFGLDINLPELSQASEIFYKKNKIEFMLGDLFQIGFPKNSFDIILFASSIQYFQDFTRLINYCRDCLKIGGEIHIIDSNFYKKANLLSAQDRSREYYENMGYPEMSKYYYHHSEDEIQYFNPKIMYDPFSKFQRLINLIIKRDSIPFFWFKVLK